MEQTYFINLLNFENLTTLYDLLKVLLALKLSKVSFAQFFNVVIYSLSILSLLNSYKPSSKSSLKV